METNPHHVLTTHDQVAEVLGTAPDFVRAKLGDRLDGPARRFIDSAPLALLGTHDSQGRVDVSPKGDAPGFVQVVDDVTLLVPERKGNNLADGFHNIIETGRIGMILLVPGQRETLRVNGTATISRDPALLDRLSAHGKPALLGTIVTVEECFFHCGKALIRSQIWDPATWAHGGDSPMVEQVVDAMGGDPSLTEVVTSALEQNYVDDLY